MFGKKRDRDYYLEDEGPANRHSQRQNMSQSAPSPFADSFYTSFKNLYPFQQELCRNATEGNCIICLPTGSGKTVIAASLVAFELGTNPEKKVVFVVNRIPLIRQQAGVIERNIPGVRVAKLTGEKKDASSLDEFLSHFDVAVTIDAVFLQWCREAPQKMSNFSLMIFDEVHHARNNSLYARLLTLIHHHNDRVEARNAASNGSLDINPIRIVGLSASPAFATTPEECESEIHGLLSRVRGELLLVTEAVGDLQKRLKMATSTLLVFKQTDFEKRMMDVFELFCIAAMNFVNKNRELTKRTTPALDAFYLFVRQPLMSSNFISMGQDALPHIRAERRRGLYALVHLVCEVAVAASLLNECSPAYAVRLLAMGSQHARYFYQPDLWESEEDTCIGEGLKSAVDQLFIAVAYLNETLLREQAERSIAAPPTPSTQDAQSEVATPSKSLLLRDCSRLYLFIDLITHILDNRGEEEVRCIVFCSTKSSAAQLVQRLCQQPHIKDMNPLLFVGKNSSAANIGISTSQPLRMTENMQHARLEEFRQGRCRLLVATSVAEEGVDVPACNYVFLYDGTVTLKSLIQIRGRARASNSFLIVLSNEMQRRQADTIFKSARVYDETLRKIASAPRRNQADPNTEKKLTEWEVDMYLHEFEQERKGTVVRQISQAHKSICIRVIATTQDNFKIVIEGSGEGKRTVLWDTLREVCFALHKRGEITVKVTSSVRVRQTPVTFITREETEGQTDGENEDPPIERFNPSEWPSRSSFLPSVLLYKEMRRRRFPPLEDRVTVNEENKQLSDVHLKISAGKGKEESLVTGTGKTEQIARESASLKLLRSLGYTITKKDGRIFLSMPRSCTNRDLAGEADDNTV